jgi:hypothetical protein
MFVRNLSSALIAASLFAALPALADNPDGFQLESTARPLEHDCPSSATAGHGAMHDGSGGGVGETTPDSAGTVGNDALDRSMDAGG